MSDIVVDEFLIFSDHHAHTFPFGAKEVPYLDHFVNSRLMAAYEVIKEVDAYAKLHNVKRVFFCGDLFHVREAVPTVAVNLMHDAICSMHLHKLYMIPGNHDYADRDGKVHSLHVFKHADPRISVRDWTSTLTCTSSGTRGDLIKYSFIPYTDDRVKATEAIKQAAALSLPGEPHILFAHLGIQGARVGSDYVLISENDLSVDDIPWQKFTACFFGHYHEHQQLFQNGWYVGASHQHNWGDANSKRGFLHVKVYIDHVTFTHVETSAPKFILSKEKKPKARPEDFVRVITSRKHTPEEVDTIRNDSGSENCEVVYMPPETVQTAIELSEENLSPVAMVGAWVKANQSWLETHLPEVENEQLVAYGKALLAKVNDS
jgi:DNA repair exonuclease SbcCD nuclease subunit